MILVHQFSNTTQKLFNSLIRVNSTKLKKLYAKFQNNFSNSFDKVPKQLCPYYVGFFHVMFSSSQSSLCQIHFEWLAQLDNF